MERDVILSHLLDKYENSKHLHEPGVSARRVMLHVDKKGFPEYDYENASIRDNYNQAALELEKDNLVTLAWVENRPVLSVIILNLDKVDACYHLVGRKHPQERAQMVVQTIERELASVSTPWIISWREEICSKAKNTFSVPAYCKRNLSFLSKLLAALVMYDSLHGDFITMRTFSSKCYRDSKYFEREVREEFLRIAQKYCRDLSEFCDREEPGVRDKLAYLGIYARPEIYELSGDFTLETSLGILNVKALTPYGIALPSTAVDAIASMNLGNISKIVFIENKTNYDEYILSEMSASEMVVYHGGFLSPQKRKFVSKIVESISRDTQVYFWADIDLGGFQMFVHLQAFIPQLLPMRMTGDDVVAFHKGGLSRSSDYLKKLEVALEKEEFPLFEDAIKRILEYGVTIEQEVFLSC